MYIYLILEISLYLSKTSSARSIFQLKPSLIQYRNPDLILPHHRSISMKKSSSTSKSKRWSPDQNPRYSLKKKMASRFLRSMKKMDCSSSPSTAEKGSWRYHAIRAAAYASMASAVGPRKAWSRALLKKIRNHKVMMRERGRKSSCSERRNPRNGGIKINIRRFGHEGLNDLSQVVPGGKAMDSCSLLTETAHYIKCLAAQVQIMKQILHYSANSSSTLY